MEIALWNIALSFISAIILLWVKATSDEQKRMQILLNRTREEIARDHITRSEFRADMQQLMDRFDRLEEKIDSLKTGRRVVDNHV